MPQPPDSLGRRIRRTLTRFLVFCLLAGLLAAVTFLLSQLNSRRFQLALQDGNLVVMKGRPLPVGTQAYRPADPRLAEAYAPVPLHGTEPGPVASKTFDDRDDLDRALFELLRTLVEPRLTDDSNERLQQGLYYLHRATLLHGITPEQRQVLARMQTDVAYYRARSLLTQAQAQVREAQEQLSLAAKTENPHQRSAQQMLLEIEGPTRALEEGLRRSVHQLSAPRPAPPAPPPAPPTSVHPEVPTVIAGDGGAP